MLRFLTRRRLLYAAVIGLGLLLIGGELYVLSPATRRAAVRGAECVGADGLLIAHLTDHDLHVRAGASDALIRRGEKAVATLLDRLDDPDPGVRKLIIVALSRLGVAALGAIPALIECAKSDDSEEVQELAAKAVGVIGRTDPSVVADLLARMGSGDQSDRLMAIRASQELGDTRAVPLLTAALASPDEQIREEAAEGLGSLGPAAASAIPALIATLDDQKPEVRSEAREALEKILRRLPAGHDDLAARAEAALMKTGFRRK